MTLAVAGCQAESGDALVLDPVVAEGNGVEVRQSAFADEYARFASIAPVQDGLEARREYAQRMLERAYIASLGERSGLGELPEVQAHVERQRAFAMRQHFLQDSLSARIDEPTDLEVRQAFRRQNSRARVRQAFATRLEDARALRARIEAGEPFEDVARTSFQTIGLDATGDLGWITFNDLDEAPEDAIFGLEVGAVSEPVESLQGWHVFQLLDLEETTRLDATAYESARERLAFDVRHRRIEEAGARVLRPLLEAHELAVDLRPLRALWPQIAPLVPDRGEADVLAAARQVFPGMQPEGLTRGTPVATVDGQPFTVGQFLDALPGVPVEHWEPTLRKAVEVAVRDSILTAHALDAGYGDDPAIEQTAAAARTTALYYAALEAAADTVTLEAHAERFYRLWRDESFVAERTTTYTATAFETEENARSAIARSQAGAPWSEVVLEAGAATDERSHTAEPGDAGPFGVHSLPLATAGQRALTGPFLDGGSFVVVEATSRSDAHVPFADVRDQVTSALQAEPRAAVHQILLDAGWNPSDVRLNDAALRSALSASPPSA
ncbi:peptidylprolyl isomerase [Rubrivirga sp.]|uniref:peptidylprolyl isomerase n=1 Tax=Rubrivirga sp. TaxID=1885344 RepID=UPI003C709BF3